MNAIDLFAGCGGLSLGFEMAGFNVVFVVEHDKSIAKSYKLNHSTAKIMSKDELSATITTRFDTPSLGKFTHPYLHRAITVREAARIQSFPDTFQFIGTKGSQMKQFGNAVPPLLAKAVAQTIMHDIKGGSL